MTRIALVLVTTALAASASAQTVWGSFDASRLAAPDLELVGGTLYGELRSILDDSGCTLAPATSTLTPTYLDGVDVFYTSALGPTTGALTAGEQAALRDWITGGGTLVVGGEYSAPAAYETFTQPFGVTDWQRSSGSPDYAQTVGVHPVVAGISYFFTEQRWLRFTGGDDARLLARRQGSIETFLVVLEAATGFGSAGRILVLGNHAALADGLVGPRPSNRRLATNIAEWTATPRWGSFDATRIETPAAVLVSGDYQVLRAKIATHGGTLARPTAELTPEYLDRVDVFFTSLLSATTGSLSAPEQAALHDWIAGGGTLIVTGDREPLAPYETFTQGLGVSRWEPVDSSGVGNVFAEHPVTLGTSSYRFDAHAMFQWGPSYRTLGKDDRNNSLIVVADPASGFTLGGRILVLGDHDMLTDALVGYSLLADNIARWAVARASWKNYGTGLRGTQRVPELTLQSLPWLGTKPNLHIRSSTTGGTGWLFFGASEAEIHWRGDGTLLVTPDVVLPIGLLIFSPTSYRLDLPPDPHMLQAMAYVQLVQSDPGAQYGYAFSRGLRMVFGW